MVIYTKKYCFIYTNTLSGFKTMQTAVNYFLLNTIFGRINALTPNCFHPFFFIKDGNSSVKDIKIVKFVEVSFI